MSVTQPPAESPLPRVLLVDDEPAIRKLLRQLLQQRYACEWIEAADGIEAQGILREQVPDVVIADLIMPRMSGLDLLRWAKDEGNRAEWILLSGAGGLDEAVQAIHLGAYDYLTKPIRNADDMVITVRNAVRHRRLEQDRERLQGEIEQRNRQLAQQVAHLQEACRLLTQQAETIETDLLRAEWIQRALLPTFPPEMDPLAVCAVHRPSRNVGGDVYDVVRLPDGHVAAYVADAAGHGLSAAMLAVVFKHRIALYDDQAEAPLPPAEVLRRVNQCLREECKAPGLFVTAAYVLLEPDGQDARLALAGHPPILLARADGSVEQFPVSSPALGLTDTSTYAQQAVSLGQGDRLLLYTDGLLTAPSPDDALTPKGIANFLVAHATDDPSVLPRLLELADESRGGRRQEDDITAVLLSVSASPSILDNGRPSDESIHEESSPSSAAPLLQIGRREEGIVVSLTGRGCWAHAGDFFELCLQELCSDRPLTVDLSQCEYLDSTFLGCLHELAAQADEEDMAFRLQGVPATIEATIEELGMWRVLAHVDRDAYSVPMDLMVVQYGNFSKPDQQQRILEAHEALADLNEGNRRTFDRVVDRLREEKQPHPV